MKIQMIVRLKPIPNIPDHVLINGDFLKSDLPLIRVYFEKINNSYIISKVVDFHGNNIEFIGYSFVLKNAPDKFMRVGTTEVLSIKI